MINSAYKYTVLIVEDKQTDYLKILRKINEVPFLRVINNNRKFDMKKEVLEKIGNCKPDILLMDVELSDCTAFDIIDSLDNSIFNTYNIVIMTSYSSEHMTHFTQNLLNNFNNKSIIYISKNELYIDGAFEKLFQLVVQKIEEDIHRICQILCKSRYGIQLFNFRFSDIICYHKRGNAYPMLYYFDLQHKVQNIEVHAQSNQVDSMLLSNKFFIRANNYYIINSFHILEIGYFQPLRETKKKYHVKMPFSEDFIEITIGNYSNFIHRLGRFQNDSK